MASFLCCWLHFLVAVVSFECFRLRFCFVFSGLPSILDTFCSNSILQFGKILGL